MDENTRGWEVEGGVQEYRRLGYRSTGVEGGGMRTGNTEYCAVNGSTVDR